MAGSYGVTITADDKTSGTIDRINKHLAAFNKEVAKTRAPLEKLARNYSTFTRLTGVDKVAGSIRAVGRAGYSAFQSVVRIVEPLGVIAGAASIAGMYRLATAWANFGTQLGQAAARAGLTAAQLHTLENGARLAGVSAEAMAGGMTTLRDNMVKATAGQAPQVVGMLQALGLNLADARRYAADTTKALPELADKISALRDPTLQAEAATALFGGAGEQLLPFLRRGSAGIAEYNDRVARYGVVNDAGVDAANRLREAQASLGLAVEGLGNSIAQQLAPVIGPLLTQMADWIARNRDWIAQGIGEKVEAFAGYLRSVDWAKVGSDIVAVVHAVARVVDGLGGWLPVGAAIAAFFGAAFLAKMLLPILQISRMLMKLPAEATVAATKAEGELAKVGKPGGNLRGRGIATGITLLEAGLQAAQGSTSEEQKQANTESLLAQFGSGLGGLLGMHFDENGKSEGLLHRWFGGGAAPAVPNVPNGVPRAGPAFGPQLAAGARAPGSDAAGAGRDYYTIGDSLARGIHDANGAAGGGTVGANPAQILGTINATPAEELRGRNVILSTGVSNNPAAISLVQQQLDALKARGVGHVTMVGTSNRADLRPDLARLNPELAEIAKRNGADFTGPVAAGADGVHPTNYRGLGIGLTAPAGPDRSLPANAGTAASPGGGPSPLDVGGRIDATVTLPPQQPPPVPAAAAQPLPVDRSMVGRD